MKRKVIVEIEYPDGFDNCWDVDTSGLQAFNDTVKVYAIAQCIDMLCMAYDKQKELTGKSTEELHDDDYIKYILQKNKVVNTMNLYGYVDDENNIHHFNRKKYEWERI